MENIPEIYRRPINLNEHEIWLKQVAKREHYAQFARHIKLLHNINSQPIFRRVVKTKFGNAYLTEIKNYIDRVANPNIYRTFDAWENVSRAARKHTVITYLAWNILTYGKQLPSVFFALKDAGLHQFLAACWEMSTDPIKLWQEVRAKDPQVYHRSMERELEELKRVNREAYNNLINKFGEQGMKGIYLIDGVAVSIHWKAVYNRSIADGMSEMDARREAQNSFLRYQPTAHAKDIAAIYSKSEYLNWFLQFSQQLNKIYALATYDIPVDIGKATKRSLTRAFMSTVSLALSAMGIWILTEKRFPEHPLDMLRAIKNQFINMIPLVGRYISAAASGWWSQSIPALKPFEAIGVAMQDKATPARKLKTALEGLAIARGIPYTGPMRVYKAVSKKDISQLIGGFGEIDLSKYPKRPGRTRTTTGRSRVSRER